MNTSLWTPEIQQRIDAMLERRENAKRVKTTVENGRTYFDKKPKTARECWALLTDEERKSFEGYVDEHGKAMRAYTMFRLLNYEHDKNRAFPKERDKHECKVMKQQSS